MYQWRIRLYRSSQDNVLYFAEPFTKRQARQDMLLLANHKDGVIVVRGNIVQIKRGQLWYSEHTISQRWQWSRNKVRRFLNYLETIQQIDQLKSKVKSVISIKNYEKYQTDDTSKGTTEGHQTIQQTDTNKNDNNIKNTKINITGSTEDFLENASANKTLESFWKEYPHFRQAKKKIVFSALKDIDPAEVDKAIKTLKREVKLWIIEHKYIPAMQRWAQGFVPVNEPRVLGVYRKMREAWWLVPDFIADFGEEETKRLWQILQNEKDALLRQSYA